MTYYNQLVEHNLKQYYQAHQKSDSSLSVTAIKYYLNKIFAKRGQNETKNQIT